MSGSKNEIALFVCEWSVNPRWISTEELSALPVDVRLVKQKCTGRIDPVLLIDPLLNGIDGVLVVGCNPGDCHFITGNLHAENKVKLVKKLLEYASMEPGRIKFDRASASDKVGFEGSLTSFVDQITKLGPSQIPLSRKELKIHEKLVVAKATIEGFRTRALVGKELELTKEGNVYGELVSRFRYEDIQEESLKTEFLRAWLLYLLKRRSFSVGELSQKTGLRKDQVLRHIVAMRQRNLVALDRIEGVTPFYKALEEIW